MIALEQPTQQDIKKDKMSHLACSACYPADSTSAISFCGYELTGGPQGYAWSCDCVVCMDLIDQEWVCGHG
jgi:hypothetical protein